MPWTGRQKLAEVVSSEAFGRYVAQVWSYLREEATRGMQDAETLIARPGGKP